MKPINWKGILNTLGKTLRRRSPEILTGLGVGGLLASTVLAVKATPEAMRRIEEKKQQDGHKKLTAAQTVQTTWQCYVPATIAGSAGIACIVGASALNGRRTAALTVAYHLAETSMREYRAKVMENIGERKEGEILDAIDRDRVSQLPAPYTSELPVTKDAVAPVLCFDATFGRTFYSDVETLKKAANKLNWRMNNLFEPYVSLNEFYDEIGLDEVDMGDLLGWRSDSGMIELRFSSHLLKDRTPCLVVKHVNPPIYRYDAA